MEVNSFDEMNDDDGIIFPKIFHLEIHYITERINWFKIWGGIVCCFCCVIFLFYEWGSMLVWYIFINSVSNIASYVFPAYKTIKSIEEDNHKDLVFWYLYEF